MPDRTTRDADATVFDAVGLLRALQACPAGATWEAVWARILPAMVEDEP